MILASTDEDTMGGGVEVMVQTENENQYYNYSRVYTTVSVLPIVVRPVLWVTDVTEKVKRGAVNSRLRGNKSSKRLRKIKTANVAVCVHVRLTFYTKPTAAYNRRPAQDSLDLFFARRQRRGRFVSRFYD